MGACRLPRLVDRADAEVGPLSPTPVPMPAAVMARALYRHAVATLREPSVALEALGLKAAYLDQLRRDGGRPRQFMYGVGRPRLPRGRIGLLLRSNTGDTQLPLEHIAMSGR